MAPGTADGQATVIAVYPDHWSAEDAVRRLQAEGIPTRNLVPPGFASVVIAGPMGAAILGGPKGLSAAAALGGLAGALVGLGISEDRAIRYESQVLAGQFVVTRVGDKPQTERAQTLVHAGKAEATAVVPAAA